MRESRERERGREHGGNEVFLHKFSSRVCGEGHVEDFSDVGKGY